MHSTVIVKEFTLTPDFHRVHPYQITNPDGKIVFYSASLKGCASTLQFAADVRPDIAKNAVVIDRRGRVVYSRGVVMGLIYTGQQAVEMFEEDGRVI
jgi:hypothetical protein